jgi:hypothetical protein
MWSRETSTGDPYGGEQHLLGVQVGLRRAGVQQAACVTDTQPLLTGPRRKKQGHTQCICAHTPAPLQITHAPAGTQGTCRHMHAHRSTHC